RVDLFISIHADAAQRASASGATLYVARNASSQSMVAARSIQAAFRSEGIPCRGIQRAGFRVLVGHSRPSVLVECGFLTNAGDATNPGTAAHPANSSAADARGTAGHLAR